MKNKTIYVCTGDFSICHINHHIVFYLEGDEDEFHNDWDTVEKIAEKALSEVNPFGYLFPGIDKRYFSSVHLEVDDSWDDELGEKYLYSNSDKKTDKNHTLIYLDKYYTPIYSLLVDVEYENKSYRAVINIKRNKFNNEDKCTF